jgi:hypothetical protein
VLLHDPGLGAYPGLSASEFVEMFLLLFTH